MQLTGPLINGINALTPDEYLGYPALSLVAFMSTLLGTLLLLRIREPWRR